MGLLDDKVAIITGAGGGLGEAYARLLASEGASVVVNDLGGDRSGTGRNPIQAQIVAESIVAAGGKAIANGSDVGSMSGGAVVFDEAIKAFGKVDILVNNAGILRDSSFAKMTEEQWDQVIRVHLKGTFSCTMPVFRFMKENGGGVIVNTASSTGLIGNFGQSNYGAAKAGIVGFTRNLAIEGRKYGIRVWAISPGALTRMSEDLVQKRGPEFKPAGPEMVAPAVLYMCCPLSGDQTGKILGVSGQYGVREFKLFQAEGWKPEAGYGAEAIARHAGRIFFAEDATVK